ncbi:MAG TPA: serine hydrolase domain-containing protein [Caulobacteraceae bacterium]|jgi:CubicO group peptidase (beta-lactamase class C family)|nr:serine hydrolase domain-containing protein [Caulobacteraceae bacterium]
MRLKAILAAALGASLLFGAAASAPAAGPAGVKAPPLTPHKAAPTPLGPNTTAPAPASTPGVTTHALTAEDANAWLDGYVPYALKSGDIPGAVVVVVKDGQVLTERGYGFADVAAQKPVDPKTTMFRPGSVSKLYTWTAVMQLVEQGKLNLDADVNQYIDFKIPAYQGKPVTLRNLMTHTGGFEEALKHLITSDPKKLYPLGKILSMWVPTRIYAPGEVPAYSNYGAALAGYIVQRTSGEPFDQYIDHHIFQPLGMEHATFTQPLPAKFKDDVAKGYPLGSLPPKPYEMINAAPAGSSAISGDDMAKFMMAQLGNGTWNGVTILKPETAKEMHTMQNQPTPPFNGMDLGFYRDDTNGHEIIAHGGDTVLFHSDLNLFINDGVGLYISMNSPGAQGAAQTVRAQLLKQFADRYFPAPKPAPLPTAPTAKHDAQIIAGTYWASRRAQGTWIQLFYLPGQIQVKALPDGMIEVMGGGPAKKLREVGPFLWQEIDGDHNLLSAVVKNGKVDHWSTSNIPAIEVMQPVPFAYRVGWNSQAFYASCLIFLSLIVCWIVAPFARRKYGHTFELSGRPAMLYRAVRIIAILDLAVAVGWLLMLTMVSKNFELLGDNLNPWMHLLQFGSLLVILGALVSIWNVFTVWTDGSRSWWAKIASVLVTLACLDFTWFVFILHLLGPGTAF